MATETPAPTLPCKECGFVNEPERVYCHNCGAKLDRSLLPKEDQLRRETPEKARKRIIRMTNPGDSGVKTAIRGTVKTLFSAAAIASIICMLRPPAEVPPEKPELSSRFVSTEIRDLITVANRPQSIQFTQGELNASLVTAKIKSESVIPGVTYKRTYVNLEPGRFRTTVEKSFWGYSIYFGTLTHAESVNRTFVGANVGGNIGRLAIHPALMQYLAPLLFKDVLVGLKPDIDLLRKAYLLKIEKGKVIIGTTGVPVPAK